MRRTFAERDPVTLGLVGTALLVAGVVAAFTVPTTNLFAGRRFVAEFAEVGGLGSGEAVVVSGLSVGKVEQLALDGNQVDVTFTVTDDNVRLGDATSASIKAETALGREELALTSSGSGSLQRIPLSRTTAPYDVTDALSDVTTSLSQVDTGKLSAALNTVSSTFQDTPPQVRAVLDGLTLLSRTVNSRDVALRDLLVHANGVSGVLAQRDTELVKIFSQGQSLLAELNERGTAIRSLLANSVAVSDQLNGLVQDNSAQLDPSLRQLDDLLTVLENNRNNLDQALKEAAPLVREMGEVVGSGPFSDAYLGNLAPTNLVPLLPELLSRGGK
jgi:phospholipid/cholesterol/gamma-HCH transport system substrate-binding protein